MTVPKAQIKLFGETVDSFSMNWYGALRIYNSSFNRSIWSKDKDIPESMDFTEAGNLLVPWGQAQTLNTCGTVVNMFLERSRLIIEYKTRDKYNGSIYMYQVQFPLKESNIVEYHYYHCVSGYTTIVGAVDNGENTASWDIKEAQPYMKKALRIDTSTEVFDEVEPVDTNFSTPFAPSPVTKEWADTFKSNTVWLLQKR